MGESIYYVIKLLDGVPFPVNDIFDDFDCAKLRYDELIKRDKEKGLVLPSYMICKSVFG